jgi:hypothetical protein
LTKRKEITTAGTGRLGRLGYLQRKILVYALLVSDRFTPSDILTYYKMKTQKMQRRVYDAIKRLERRGVLEKIARGLYRLNSHVDLSMSDLQILRRNDHKENDFNFGKLIGDCGVVRIHAIGAEGLLHFLFYLSFLRYVSAGVLRHLQQYMESRFSRGVVRSIVRRAYRLAGSVAGLGDFIVGAHGLYGVGCRRELFPIEWIDQFAFREVGIDIKLPCGLKIPRLHVKFYTAQSPYGCECGVGVCGDGARMS